jgi:hypothetical protein
VRPSALAAAFALAALPASAQHVLFEEDFEGGIPPTWTNIHNSAHLDPWRPGFGLVDGSNDINHEWFCTVGFILRDNILLSPVIDLSGVTAAFVECGQVQRLPMARVLNTVEITTDGGQSYTVVYNETGMFTGFGSIKVDISAFAGNANVQIGFHYVGVVANDWSIDNVRVTTSPVQHVVTELQQGLPATFGVVGAVPGNAIYMMLAATGAGPLPSPWGNLNLFPPIVFFPGMIADPTGQVNVNVTVPAGTAGLTLYSQAIEFALPTTINITNSMARTII